MISLRILIQIHIFFIMWIHLRVFFPKISKSLIYLHIALSDLTEFQNIPRNYLNSQWIRLLFTTILLNSWLFDKIGEFGNCFDSWPCVFNDFAVSIRYPPPSLENQIKNQFPSLMIPNPHIAHSIYLLIFVFSCQQLLLISECYHHYLWHVNTFHIRRLFK